MTLNTKIRLNAADLRSAVTLSDAVQEDPLTAAIELLALRNVARIASELCTAIDRSEKDIGGARRINAILADLGPACDVVEHP